jgi:hypothetical protein
VALDELRRAFPKEAVTRMPHNNAGFDIRVGSAERPVRYVEVKSTRTQDPTFLISEYERLFSLKHAAVYMLLVVTGIDTAARTHGHTYRYDGRVEGQRFMLHPLQWQGKGPT